MVCDRQFALHYKPKDLVWQ